MERKRMSKKMLEEMDRIANGLRSVIEFNSDCIHLIPDYYRKLLNDFEILSKDACERGWDFGYNTNWYAEKLKEKLDKLEVKE